MGVMGGNSHQKGCRGFALNNVVRESAVRLKRERRDLKRRMNYGVERMKHGSLILLAAWITGAGAVRATAAELPGRFQIFVAPGPRDAALPSIIIKLDTMTGETWKLVWMELPLPVSAQRPGMKSMTVESWMSIHSDSAEALKKAEKVRDTIIRSPTPPPK